MCVCTSSPTKNWGHLWGQRPQKEHILPHICDSLIATAPTSRGAPSVFRRQTQRGRTLLDTFQGRNLPWQVSRMGRCVHNDHPSGAASAARELQSPGSVHACGQTGATPAADSGFWGLLGGQVGCCCRLSLVASALLVGRIPSAM